MKLKTKFQDEDFDLGEVVEVDIATMPDGRIKLQGEAKAGGLHTIFYDSLEKLYNDWEDAPVEQPKGIVRIEKSVVPTYVNIEYSTEEEAEKAIEKIKAWKRLENNNLRVVRGQRMFVNADNKITSQRPLFVVDTYNEVEEDLDILFGGKE